MKRLLERYAGINYALLAETLFIEGISVSRSVQILTSRGGLIEYVSKDISSCRSRLSSDKGYVDYVAEGILLDRPVFICELAHDPIESVIAVAISILNQKPLSCQSMEQAKASSFLNSEVVGRYLDCLLGEGFEKPANFHNHFSEVYANMAEAERREMTEFLIAYPVLCNDVHLEIYKDMRESVIYE